MILRVKNTAELDKLAGRAPQAAQQTPAAPAPAPAKAVPPAPAAPVVDHEARNLLRANADQLRALTELVLKQAANPAPAVAPVAPPAPPIAPEPAPQQAAPAPPPAPSSRLLDFLPSRPVLDVAAASPAPAPQPAPVAAPPQPTAPIIATISRDKKDRLAGVAMTGGANLQASVVRGKADRITEVVVVRDGRKQRFSIRRDKRDRIETIAEQPIN